MDVVRDVSPSDEVGQRDPAASADPDRLACLCALERKVLWLSTWMIHNANHVRPSRDGMKVGGHQASCASLATLMTALYFDVLRPQDRVAVKPHASPIFHAISYLMGRLAARTARAVSRLWRCAIVPIAHQGQRRRRFLDRLGRPGSGDHALRRAGPGLSSAQGSCTRGPARRPDDRTGG